MAESFLAVVADKVLSQIISLFTEETVLTWDLKADLRKLQNTITNVKAVILDAEEAQLTSHEVCTWLGQLKDVLFDAEDVFDEFAYEALRKKIVNSPTHGSTRKKVRRFMSASSNPIAYRLRMRSKVRQIREAFDEVAANKAKFHLNTHHLVPNNPTLLLNQRELSHSFVDPSQLIGRDGDRDAILASLLSHDASVKVVSIVGMGGLGKTALAKMVFNDVRVDDRFKKKIWVCLGDLNEFNVKRVLTKVVKSITGEKSDDLDPERLQKCFRENLGEERFLLVLDDVWDMGRDKWLDFKELLVSGGARGSKVMVTTRDSSVTINMDSALTHSLKGLPHDECVSLFKKFAFREGGDDQNLMKIGDVIVGKCKGVPLAVKSLGCLLFSKPNTSDWEFVRDNEIWQLGQKDGILPALKISYDQLSFTLKQCFLYCSIFPKDHEFFNLELIKQWLSYRLLTSTASNKKTKDLGQQYIDELYARGFFQDVQDFVAVRKFKMHDLFHDLALSIAHNELNTMKGDRQDRKIYKRIRHVSFSRREGLGGEKVPKLFSRNNSRSSCVMPTIWSLFFDDIGGEPDCITQLVNTCVSELKYLRNLDLEHVSSLERLPSSIGSLKHLRDLDLDGCKKLKRLPDSICQLYNLQRLSMDECVEFEELPKDIGDLVNLTELGISTRQKRLSEGVGKGIESLSSLQLFSLSGCENLEYVFESGESETHPPKLWTSLQILSLQDCRSLTSLTPSTPSVKRERELSHLEALGINDCPNINLASMFNDQIRLVALRSLLLIELPQMELLPEWINDEGCATTLELLQISNCSNLTSLPEWLSKLTSLRQLFIYNCPEVLVMPEGLRGLKELAIEDCPELSRRCKRGIGEDWPNIKHIPKIVLDGELE